MAMRITGLDHLVLTVRSIEETVRFYERVLGVTAVRFGAGRIALSFGAQKINLHQKGAEFDPKADLPTPGSADLCFLSDGPMDSILRHLDAENIEILDGPVRRTGARGPITSVYLRDPDRNLLEISVYETET